MLSRIRATGLSGWIAVSTLSAVASAEEPPQTNETSAGEAQGDERSICDGAYESAQITRRAGKSVLLSARKAAQTCLSMGCEPWMVSDCSVWLSQIDARVPGVVFLARTSLGRDLLDVTVTTEDGEKLTERLDGVAIEVEPGPYTFVFTMADGQRREKQVIVREGQRAQEVSVSFDPSPEERAAHESQQQQLQVKENSGPVEPSKPVTPPLRYLGYGLLGAGGLGLALGAGFGVAALSSKGSARCDDAGRCTGENAQQHLDSAGRSADVSTVAFLVGGALAVGGVGLVLFAKPKSAVKVQPSVGFQGGSLSLSGSF